jgi:hypothetical protein
MDADHLSIDRLYRRLKRGDTHNILPLVTNLADPSPALGWRNRERKSLAERSFPDLTLCLALIHHLVIAHNIPVQELVDWLADMQGHLIVEFVTREDPMVAKLLLNKRDNYDDYRLETFEALLRERFDVIDRCTLPSTTRVLFFAGAKGRGR